MPYTKLVHPSTILVSGPTGCGKTQFVANLIKYNMFSPMPEKIVWCYGEDQSLYRELALLRPEIDFVNGIPPDLYDSLDANILNLVIFDDQMSKTRDSTDISRFFTEGSHHRNLSIIYIVQNLFDKGKSHRTVSLNAQYMVLFKNPRDRAQVGALAKQMFPGKCNSFYLLSSFMDATSVPYGYLLLDLRQETPEEFRLRTSILPNESCFVYAPSKYANQKV